MLERWRGGDNAAGHALFERHFENLYGFFATKLPEEADDLVQRTMLACVRGRDSFRGDASYRTYLFAIARNQLYSAIAAKQQANARFDASLSSIAQLASSAGTILARDQEQRALLTALQQLPVEQQTLLELHYWQELDMAQIAEIFESNAATIRQRIHRARKALRDLLEQTAPPSALETDASLDAWVVGLGRR